MDGIILLDWRSGILIYGKAFNTQFESNHPKHEWMNLASLLFALINFGESVFEDERDVDNNYDYPSISVFESQQEKITFILSVEANILVAVFSQPTFDTNASLTFGVRFVNALKTTIQGKTFKPPLSTSMIQIIHCQLVALIQQYLIDCLKTITQLVSQNDIRQYQSDNDEKPYAILLSAYGRTCSDSIGHLPREYITVDHRLKRRTLPQPLIQLPRPPTSEHHRVKQNYFTLAKQSIYKHLFSTSSIVPINISRKFEQIKVCNAVSLEVSVPTEEDNSEVHSVIRILLSILNCLSPQETDARDQRFRIEWTNLPIIEFKGNKLHVSAWQNRNIVLVYVVPRNLHFGYSSQIETMIERFLVNAYKLMSAESKIKLKV